jgi:hypothetical protein
MADGVRTPRSRGSLSGLVLILLGAWGGIAPYAGPSLGFGYTPDEAWTNTSGRLYLSAIPGGVVLVAGLIMTMSRSRWLGGLCAFIAALGGTWFIAGAALVTFLPASQAASISTGKPLGSGAHIAVLTNLALFTGVGVLILFFAASGLGRFSLAAHRDFSIDNGDLAGLTGAGTYGGYQPAQESAQPQYASQYARTDPFPPAHYAAPTEQYPSAAQQPATQDQPSAGQYQSPAGQSSAGQSPAGQSPAAQYGQPNPYGVTQEQSTVQRSQSPFPPAPFPGSPAQTTTPESTKAAEQQPGQNQAR